MFENSQKLLNFSSRKGAAVAWLEYCRCGVKHKTQNIVFKPWICSFSPPLWLQTALYRPVGRGCPLSPRPPRHHPCSSSWPPAPHPLVGSDGMLCHPPHCIRSWSWLKICNTVTCFCLTFGDLSRPIECKERNSVCPEFLSFTIKGKLHLAVHNITQSIKNFAQIYGKRVQLTITSKF